MAVNTKGPGWWVKKAEELRRLRGRLSGERHPELCGAVMELVKAIEKKYGGSRTCEGAGEEEE